MRGCGEQIWPEVPKAQREEIEGLAAATGLGTLEILFLHTRFELERFGLLKGRARFRGHAIAERGKRVVQRFHSASLGVAVDRLVFVLRPESLLVALPGMVGGFCGARPGCVAAFEPMDVAIDPSLKAPPWTVFLRAVVETPPAIGTELPLAPSIYASVPINAEGLGLGTLAVGPPGVGFLAVERFAWAANVSQVPSGSTLVALSENPNPKGGPRSEPDDLLSEAPPDGARTIGLRATPDAVEIRFRFRGAIKTAKVSFKRR